MQTRRGRTRKKKEPRKPQPTLKHESSPDVLVPMLSEQKKTPEKTTGDVSPSQGLSKGNARSVTEESQNKTEKK